MTNLSKTNLENLEAMISSGGYTKDFKGHGRHMAKMIDDGLVTRHVWNGSYVWQITAKGRGVAQ